MSAAVPAEDAHLPGEVGVWVFVLGDMVVFALFFSVYVYYRSLAPELFDASQATLNQHYGALNTILLLVSSWFVAMAVIDLRERDGLLAGRLFGGAIACGLGFGVVKVIEYGEKLRAGIGITTNDFYMYYFIFTGLHFVHVLIGLGVLTYLFSLTRRTEFTVTDMRVIESGGIFWHMVDLLWIVLFPLIYLVR